MGFISRQEAEEYLHKSENETFLVRFSDSELGGVTVAWITGSRFIDTCVLRVRFMSAFYVS